MSHDDQGCRPAARWPGAPRRASGIPVIAHVPVDVSALYGDRVVLPFGHDEEGQLAGWPLSGTARPHALITGCTGSGVTSLLVLLAVEAARQGVEVWCCDPKRYELARLRGWPHITRTATRAADMVQLAGDFHAEMSRRSEQLETSLAQPADLRRVLLILGDYEVFTMLVADWWQDRPERQPGDPKAHPVMRQLRQCAAMSPAARMHLAVGARRPPADWAGDGARHSFGFRVSLGPLSKQAARTLWGDPGVGTGQPAATPGLGVATTPGGPRQVTVHWLPSPADAAAGDLAGEDLARLQALLPPGTAWDRLAPAR